MIIYFIIFSFLFLMSLFDFVVRKDQLYNYIYIGFAIFIFFIAAFRGMGNDYDGYREIFDSIQDIDFISIFDPSQVYVEPGFAILNFIIGYFLPYQTILIIMAAANISILFPFFRKYSPYPYATLLFFAGMFMYSGMMGLIRQALAISICLWAMAESDKRRFWWLVLLATTFHYSAILVIIARFIKDKFYTLKTYLVILGIAITSNLLFYGIFKLMVAFLPQVISWKLQIYLGTEEGIHFGFNAAVAIRLFTFSLAYLYRDKIIEYFPKHGPLFVNLYFLAIVIYTGFGFLPQMAARGAVYFHYMELLVVPIILYCASNLNRTWIFTLYTLFSLWRHIEMVTTYADAYVPYKNILFS